MTRECGMGRRIERTVLVLGVPKQPWDIEDIFPLWQVIVVAGTSCGKCEMLVAQLWERSVRLDAIVALEALPSQEMLTFLVVQGLVLVDAHLAKDDVWQELLHSSRIEERQAFVELM
jgi:hypothetical protein